MLGQRGRTLRTLPPVLTMVALLAVWQLIVAVLRVPRFLLPSPSGILSRVGADAGYLTGETLFTLQEVLLGFGLSVVVGVPLAILIVQWKAFESSVYPLLVSSQVIPKVAIAPLLVVWFGFGLAPKVLVAFLVAFFPIVIDSVMGLRSVEVEKIYLVRSMGAGAIQTFFKVRLPNALPSMFSGIKLAMTFSIIGAVIGEFMGSDRGIGRVLLNANFKLDTELMFAGIFILTLLGVALFIVVDIVERVMIPWHVSQRMENLVAGTT